MENDRSGALELIRVLGCRLIAMARDRPESRGRAGRAVQRLADELTAVVDVVRKQ